MVPPLYRYSKLLERPLDPAASGAVPLETTQEGQRVGPEAEKMMFDMLQSFGNSVKYPMIVISSFKHGPLAKLTKTAADQGELDFLVIHRDMGLILMEVKGLSKEVRPNNTRILEAKRQLTKADNLIRKLPCVAKAVSKGISR